MLEFLSPEWLDALDDAGRAATSAPAPEAHIDLVVEQVVTGDPSTTYHVELTGGRARFRPGPAPEPDLRFTADRATAWAIASGHESAQRAFMAGRLQMGGDLRTLYEHQDALGALSDAFASVREQTTATDAPPGTTGT